MKTYNDREFRDEVLKRLGWTEKQLSDYLNRKTKETLSEAYTEDDVMIFVKRLTENSKTI